MTINGMTQYSKRNKTFLRSSSTLGSYKTLNRPASPIMVLLHIGLLAIALMFPCSAAAVDLTSPKVFNANFYINNNVEVLNAHIRDVASAQNHWLHHGIDMGLQACGSFHTAQYLQRYADLSQAFGTNYRQALEHYLTLGHAQEGRLGYLEGGYGGRWTVSDPHQHHGLFLSASRRMGAAVDSLVWDDTEFINAWDHGRELQMAMNFVPNGECFNPTEAGGRDDSQHNTTHTTIQSVTASGDSLVTQVLPAFWLQTGHTITQSSGSGCQKGMAAHNVRNTYQHAFSKRVVLRCPGVAQACVHFTSTFTIAGEIPAYTILQMEAPTGYLTGEFSHFRSFDHSSGRLVSYDNRKPVVVSTPDDRHAMGVFSPPDQDTDHFMYYGRGQFPNHVSPAATNKWNVVFRKDTASLPAAMTHVLSYDAFLCVGSVSDVSACLKALLDSHQNGGLIG